MKAMVLAAVAMAAAVASGDESFGFASWNIGHFALGLKSRPTIPEAYIPGKIAEYKAFIGKADAKVIGICEHECFIDSNKTVAVKKTIFSDYGGVAVGQRGQGRLNALYWNGAECIKMGMVKFEKHSQHRYYRFARLKIAGREVCFVMTHLDWNHIKPGHEQDRASQIAKLVEDLKDEPYVVLGGDFNTCIKEKGVWTDAPKEYEPFRKAGFCAAHWGELKTCPASKPYRSIDNIFVKGFDISDVRVQADPMLSDHALIRCTLTFKRAAAARPMRSRSDLVAKVATSEISEARASWWGFDEYDATECLQSAISSGAKRLVVENMEKPWIVRPLFGVSNQEIVFEDGVEILAKKGEFRGASDCLFTLDRVTNVVLKGYSAVLRMRRDDYRKPPYGGEHRHALRVRTSENVTVEGLCFAESGGDGIYLGEAYRNCPNRNIVIRNVTCERNYRQGMSVIAADGLLIEDCVFRDTKGTPPASGIDFEPNYPSQMLKGIVVRRCLSENNKGRGFEFALGQSEGLTPPIDALFEDCRVVGCGDSFALGMRFNAVYKEGVPLPKGGRLELRRCKFEKPLRSGIVVVRKPYGTIDMNIVECTIEDAPERDGAPAVKLVNHMYDNNPVDGIVFENLTIKRSEPKECDWLNSGEFDWTGVGVRRFEGNITIVEPKKTHNIVLDEAWRRKSFPHTNDPILPRVRFDPEGVTVVDRKPNETVPLSQVRVRYKGRYIFYADGKRAAEIRLEQGISNKRVKPSEKPLLVKNMKGEVLAEFRFGTENESCVLFNAPLQGFYVLEVDAGRQNVVFKSSNVPIALEFVQRPQTMYRGNGELYFASLPGRRFSLFVSGDGLEKVCAKVFSPSGKKVFEESEISGWRRVQPNAGDVEAGLWRIELSKPPTGAYFDDYFLDLSGVPGLMFLSPEKYWLPR